MTLYLCATQKQSEAAIAPEARGCGHFWHDDGEPQICPHCGNAQSVIRPIEAKPAIDAFLTEAGIAYSATYQGETTRDGVWKCDAWRCAVGKHEFPYYTGLGRRSPAPRPMDGGPLPRRNTLMWESLEKQRKPIAPHAADLLHSLLLDSTAADMSFADWCGDYGYSDDSLNAFDTYRACCDIGKTMRQLFTPAQRETLSTILQDY